MSKADRTAAETRVAQRYFGSFADDYHKAFEGSGANPLHHLINRLFRRKTFVLRTALVEKAFRDYGVAGTDANASILGSACRWRITFDRWPNVSDRKLRQTWSMKRFHVNLRSVYE